VRRRAMRCCLDIFYPPEIEISLPVGIYTNNNNLIIRVPGHIILCCPPEFDVRRTVGVKIRIDNYQGQSRNIIIRLGKQFLLKN